MRLCVFLLCFIFLSGYGQNIKLRGDWKFHIGDNLKWASPEFDDSSWETIWVPSPWEDEGFNGYDGFAWYRKTFNGNLLSRGDQYYLNLGYVDDCDVVYLNGYAIGLSGSMPPKFKTAYNTERKYAIPADIINYNGGNVLAVRVFDVTLSGGIVDGAIGIYKARASHMIVDLQGLWDFAVTRSESVKPDDWNKVMVPSMWEHQGYPKYDGYAWYRKSFELPTSLPSENLYLLAGKIDDFDKVYLNGKLIGATRDNRSMGFSQSYEKLRAYEIPKSILKSEGANLLEVFVEDMGLGGGIYEGPVGVITESNLRRYYQ